MEESNQRLNRGTNPSKHHLQNKRHNGKFIFIKQKNKAVREALKEMM